VASFRPFKGIPGRNINLIEGNTISDADSLFPYYIIGIDVQGDSEGLDIRGNVIDVIPGRGPYNPQRQMGIRVRENVDRRSILIRMNTMDEGVVFPTGDGEKYEPRMESGGCPFTRGTVWGPSSGTNPHVEKRDR